MRSLARFLSTARRVGNVVHVGSTWRFRLSAPTPMLVATTAIGSEVKDMATTAAARAALGHYGESVAERHLIARGMILLDRNWRCDEGELDLVLREGPVLVACEVKTRTGTSCGSPHEAVGRDKLDRLRRLAERWTEVRGLNPPEIRIDLVAVMRPGRGAAVVDHVRGL